MKADEQRRNESEERIGSKISLLTLQLQQIREETENQSSQLNHKFTIETNSTLNNDKLQRHVHDKFSTPPFTAMNLATKKNYSLRIVVLIIIPTTKL